MRNRLACGILVLIIASIFVGLAIIKLPKYQKSVTKSADITITTSFYPLADFAKKIAGEKADVINITPPGSEPHDYDPTPKDQTLIYKSDLFIYNGVNLEGWVDKVITDLKDSKVKTLKATTDIATIGEDTKADPHIWLDPVLSQKMVINIRDAIITLDPSNAEYYKLNADNLIVKLIDLDQRFTSTLHDCPQKDIVTSHEALSYLSQRYRFSDFPISGINPDEEPSPQKMADLVDLVKAKRVKYILTETLISPKLAETISQETGAVTIPFNTLESLTKDELASNEDYFSVQNKNITNLSTALECQKK